MARVDWASTGLDFQQRIKAQWLRADLTSLGVPEEEIAALPQLGSWPSLVSPADAMGALYVLEGATLGGRMILSQLTPELGVTAQCGAQFFASYGVETGAKWRDFLAALAPFGEMTYEAARVEQAAQATFACFLGWVRARQASRLVARGRTYVRQ
jgi:heme oxygenase